MPSVSTVITSLVFHGLLARSVAYDCPDITTTAEALFVCHDAGESLGLLPAALALSSTVTGNTVSVAILALGQPAGSIFAGYPGAVTLPDLGINTTVIDRGNRTQLLADIDVKRIVSCFTGLRMVIVGEAYTMQAQLAAAFTLFPNIHVAGFDDGFGEFNASSLGGGFITGGALPGRDTPVIDTAIVTAKMISEELSNFTAAHEMSGPKVLIAGSPTIGSWRDAAANHTEVLAVREQLYGNDTRPAVLFAGGYGAGYTTALTTFARAVKILHTKMQFSFSLHPGLNGSLERSVFETEGVTQYVPFVTENISTSVAVAASNASLSQGSTCGIQSLYIGRPSAFVQAPEAPARDVFAIAGLIPLAEGVIDLVSVLDGFEDGKWMFNQTRLEVVGVPLNATAIITANVRNCVRGQC